MKVLFLDIDGVLNCESTKEKIGERGGIFVAMHGLDARLVKRLKDWLALHPDVKVVISSTWRLDERMLEIVAETILFIDITQTMANRQTEIIDWLQRHEGVTHFAILDDIAQFNANFRHHFVQTSYVHGLRDKDLRRIEDILGLKALDRTA
jgi:hypothetical protein